jgi:hypothetical protein
VQKALQNYSGEGSVFIFLGFETRNAGVGARATSWAANAWVFFSLADKAVLCSFNSSVNGRAGGLDQVIESFRS